MIGVAKKAKSADNVLAQNKKARHDYIILETYEAGIVLTGTEIKSVRNGRINLKDGFARVRNGEVWLENVHISPYEQGNQFNVDPLRNRKLLLRKKEIGKLLGATQGSGITLVPLRVYLKHGFAKLLLGVAKGKHTYDKRETLKRRDQDRELQRVMKNHG
ncbi:SsrA-binding protein [Loigolactobacillus coryniformis subsp. torquens DSM 20004 = KCTC 3535]|nr:SsrA-binding protein [Loigolactobacillus coryniformis subsp. torquens DSM 20004 = KCTC 3535]